MTRTKRGWAWLGVNVVETGDMHYWTVFKPREDLKELTPVEGEQ